VRPIVLDRNAPTSLHRQIYEQWRRDILNGRVHGGERVPSTRDLASALSVSRTTITEAYDQLIAEGYLESAHGSGTFVCHELPDALLRPQRPPVRETPEDPPLRLSDYGAGLKTDYRYPPALPGYVNFIHWRPDLAHFPFPLWRRMMSRHLRRADPEIFDYAGDPVGIEPLRQEIASYVGRSRGVHCTPDQVVVVNGSQQGIDLSLRLLLERGEDAAVENPGYQGAHRILTAYGARLRPVPVDNDGIVVAALKGKERIVYVTPSHQFPTGVAMSLARRLELIEWARKHGAVIIEDDYDSEYRYSGPPLPSLQGLARGVPVIYIGTFSKVMFPGLRIGYIVAPKQLVKPLSRAKWLADRQTPVLEQATLADFLHEGHLERHVRKMRRLYGRRRQVLIAALARHFGDSVQVLGDPAGMHVLVRFAGIDILSRAARNRVHVADASQYYLTNPPRNEVILGFASITEAAIREGVRRLSIEPPARTG